MTYNALSTTKPLTLEQRRTNLEHVNRQPSKQEGEPVHRTSAPQNPKALKILLTIYADDAANTRSSSRHTRFLFMSGVRTIEMALSKFAESDGLADRITTAFFNRR